MSAAVVKRSSLAWLLRGCRPATLFCGTLALALGSPLLPAGAAEAEVTCTTKKEKPFGKGEDAAEQVRSVEIVSGEKKSKLVLFKARLRINTDGAPNSYHPFDLEGKEKAINSICSGMTVYELGEIDPATGKKGKEKKLSCSDARPIIEKFRDADWLVPDGYRIAWKSVFAAVKINTAKGRVAARKEGEREVPCVFATGEHQGWLGSLTSLKNGLKPKDRGECQVANQLDQRVIPALVLAGGSTPLREFGAKVGDLVLAINPKNGVEVAAVIGDVGPEGRIGEGSVALNMALLQKTEQPTCYKGCAKAAEALDTEKEEMLVAILPKTSTFELVRPYTRASLEERLAAWSAKAEIGDKAKLAETVQACAAGL